MSSTTITITAAERDVILDRLWKWDGEGTDPLPFDTREEASETLAKLHRAFDLRDEVGGWDDAQDTRESFVATVTPELIELLRETVVDAVEGIEYERKGLDMSRSGHEGAWYCSTLEETVAAYEGEIARHENERDVCRALLARMDAGAVTA